MISYNYFASKDGPSSISLTGSDVSSPETAAKASPMDRVVDIIYVGLSRFVVFISRILHYAIKYLNFKISLIVVIELF